jgi:hypothetical protein
MLPAPCRALIRLSHLEIWFQLANVRVAIDFKDLGRHREVRLTPLAAPVPQLAPRIMETGPEALVRLRLRSDAGARLRRDGA